MGCIYICPTEREGRIHLKKVFARTLPYPNGSIFQQQHDYLTARTAITNWLLKSPSMGMCVETFILMMSIWA